MVEVGDTSNGDEILEVQELSDGQTLIRTEGDISENDFRVKLINEYHPRGVTVKYAHFAIDFYGKLQYDREIGGRILQSLVDIWHGKPVSDVLKEWDHQQDLPGYNLDYVFYAMAWILEQEDINYGQDGRSESKQEEIDGILREQGVKTPSGREGSELAISLFCDIANGTHPVEAFYRVNLRI
jgi:hypothetical protein